jgi:SAM-dependent methyltransferase
LLRFDPDFTASYYDEYGERETTRWEKDDRARFEFEVYCNHLREHVRSGERVLDAGCGPGTFAKVLLELGARVTCLDVSKVQLKACRRFAPGADEYVRGTVTDLSRFPDGSFDVSLALGGPISYCLDRASDAVRELRRVTRPGGLVGLSVMSLFGTIHRFLPGVLPLPVETNRQIFSSGDLPRDVNDGHECHLFRVEELRTLLRDAGLEELELHASGWLIPNGEVEIPDPDTAAWRMLLEAETRASAEVPGAGTHLIAWGRAPH